MSSDQYKIIPARHPWRYIGVALSLLIIAVVAESIFSNKNWGWPVFRQWFLDPAILNGLLMTLKLTFWSIIFSLILGTIVAMMRLSSSWLVRSLAWVYIWMFRSLPLLLVLIILYNFSYLYEYISVGIPFTNQNFAQFKTINALDQFSTALVGLVIVQSAYTAEVIRGGILSVDHGQFEAAAALGLSWWRRTTRIILPQSIRSIIPAIINECVGLSKGTSIVYVLAMPELFYTVQMIYNRNQEVIPLLMVAAVWYIIVTSVFSIVQWYIEKILAKGERRSAINHFSFFRKTKNLSPQQRVGAGYDS
ncbi:amino acid ABC transporter permease [Acinetobacter qingfengensis]|uniref:ABC transporter permease n=1 Tax=Acinetobacter qingfengensis TaxID=1262585 RepID=A0A1E7R424_9GAMM|nr:amino acid ABC transporter permease [Acinetobacter qingfengensis]KAA8733735.1 amino acid ABC transporter permease [Acinetobacter qingfengensis]OEY94041.1 ABC transporter permease [Acinetobacter qingfengensis]